MRLLSRRHPSTERRKYRIKILIGPRRIPPRSKQSNCKGRDVRHSHAVTLASPVIGLDRSQPANRLIVYSRELFRRSGSLTPCIARQRNSALRPIPYTISPVQLARELAASIDCVPQCSAILGALCMLVSVCADTIQMLPHEKTARARRAQLQRLVNHRPSTISMR